ncbi:MAG: NADH:flavin oxidoreductase [Alistipes sp.]|nr:NADH:flavin oxidoreductase [Alistipes sp.]
MQEEKRLQESKLFTPYKLGSVELRNRVIRSAAFESMGKDFGPTQALKDYHVSVAKGGVGMTTVAYASINRSGISFNKQLWLRDEIVPQLRDLTDAVHNEGAAVGIQLGHCGNMTHWSTAGSFPVSASNGFNLYSPTFHRRMSKSEIVEFAKDFGKAVETAYNAGFDSVEVHAGHGYLISQFLSPYTNHRRDEYGGSLENRMRFMNMCLEEVVTAARKRGMGVLVKHNMEDGFKGGIQVPESIEIAKQIETFGVDGIVLSSGFVSKAPMAVMRGRIPTKTMGYYMGWNEWLQKIVVSLFGQWLIKQYDFEECYFLENAKKFREALKGPLVYVGGLVSREGIERVLDEGFELVQMARALVNDPAFVNKLKAGDMATRSGCDHRDYCMARMYSVDMQCCHNCKEHIPERLWKEINKIK